MSGQKALVVAGLLVALAVFSACQRRPAPKVKAQPTATPAPKPTPTPPIYVPNKRIETGKIFNGMQFRSELVTEWGSTATAERETPSSYAAELVIRVKVPKPNTTLPQITQLNEELPSVLPGLEEMVATAKVSDYYDNLYRAKVNNIRAEMNRLDQVPTRHNFFDCETILELEHPRTKRKALMVQADMDVDTDGSDSDRVSDVENTSMTYQTMTSYKWRKRTANPNPLIPLREARRKRYADELASSSISAERAADLRAAIKRLDLELLELNTTSSLVSKVDPFIVLPSAMVGKNRLPFTPRLGDYCAVVHKGMIYPAILGDLGPSSVIGEASLRLCKAINERANGNNRPMSHLKITYLVFPDTADKPFGPPDFELWQKRVAQLLQEIGGYTGELHMWEDLTKPSPTPTPTPTPSPSVAPSPSAAPVPSLSPGASPKSA